MKIGSKRPSGSWTLDNERLEWLRRLSATTHVSQTEYLRLALDLLRETVGPLEQLGVGLPYALQVPEHALAERARRTP